MTGLVVTGLHKGFGPVPVLTGVDLEVPAGSFTAVLGPSGSGKTTLLRVLAGFERPDRGTVTIGDLVVDDDRHHVPTEERRVSYVSQEGSLFPHLSVQANIGFGLPRRERRGARVKELLDMVGLAGLGRRYPHQLSGGQQQRVALARALAVRPRVVLLDEPFASLDVHLRASVRADVQGILRRAGTTAVLVTHDQEEALSIADLVAVIRDGKVAQCATPRDLYSRPLDVDLARFVGSANVVDGMSDGRLVGTAFGDIAVEGGDPVSTPHPVVVLVRPEQVEIHADLDGAGLRGRVLGTSFHGHDAVVRVGTETDCVVVRVIGDPHLEAGSPVRLCVRGPVRTWPLT
jgi:iron(III) transport system ATP-binding protein